MYCFTFAVKPAPVIPLSVTINTLWWNVQNKQIKYEVCSITKKNRDTQAQITTRTRECFDFENNVSNWNLQPTSASRHSAIPPTWKATYWTWNNATRLSACAFTKKRISQQRREQVNKEELRQHDIASNHKGPNQTKRNILVKHSREHWEMLEFHLSAETWRV
jgi:hypothetical protein